MVPEEPEQFLDKPVLFMKHKPPLLDSASEMGGAGGGPLAGYGVGSSTSTTTGAKNGTYGSGGRGAFGGATNQLNRGNGGNGPLSYFLSPFLFP